MIPIFSFFFFLSTHSIIHLINKIYDSLFPYFFSYYFFLLSGSISFLGKHLKNISCFVRNTFKDRT